jgi:hypothetical protein
MSSLLHKLRRTQEKIVELTEDAEQQAMPKLTITYLHALVKEVDDLLDLCKSRKTKHGVS